MCYGMVILKYVPEITVIASSLYGLDCQGSSTHLRATSSLSVSNTILLISSLCFQKSPWIIHAGSGHEVGKDPLKIHSSTPLRPVRNLLSSLVCTYCCKRIKNGEI